MKRKIIYLITATALITSAFFIGKSTVKSENTIQLEKAIPLSDVACWYIDQYDYITIELNDVTHQLDNYANVSYSDILKDIPDETETYKNNMVDMSKVIDFKATEDKLRIYLKDGSEYYWER